MRKHMDVFFFLTKIKEDMKLSLKELKPFLQQSFDMSDKSDPTDEQISHLTDLFVRFPPDNTQKINYLRDLGYSPGFISKYLGLTPSTVSYHLNRKEKGEYINGYAIQYVRNLDTEKYRIG